MSAPFTIQSKVENSETIANGRAIRELDRLIEVYGPGNWRKRKGMATVCLPSGRFKRAELHWYEAHGIGKREFKLKRLLD